MIWRIFFLCLGLVAAPLFGEDSVDGLFTEAAPDVVADTKAKADLAALNTAPLSMTGHVYTNGGGLVGESPTGFFNFDTDFSIDARPDPSLRFHGALSTALANSSIPTPTLSELYLDYTLLNTVLLRMGRYTIAWGQGRMFNPGNLLADSPNGVAVKAVAPVLGQSLTLAFLGNPGVMSNPAAPTYRELVYAAQLAGDLGPLGWGVATRVRPGTVLATPQRQASAFLKTSWLGVDLFAEGIFAGADYQLVTSNLHYLTGFFWEGGSPKWQLQGEMTDTRWGVSVKLSGWALTPVAHWEQSRLDGSGTVAVGITWSALPHLTIDFGIPWLYGPDGSEYLVNCPDPHKQRLGAGLRVTLDTTF